MASKFNPTDVYKNFELFINTDMRDSKYKAGNYFRSMYYKNPQTVFDDDTSGFFKNASLIKVFNPFRLILIGCVSAMNTLAKVIDRAFQPKIKDEKIYDIGDVQSTQESGRFARGLKSVALFPFRVIAAVISPLAYLDEALQHAPNRTKSSNVAIFKKIGFKKASTVSPDHTKQNASEPVVNNTHNKVAEPQNQHARWKSASPTQQMPEQHSDEHPRLRR